MTQFERSLAGIAIVALLAACSATVVREGGASSSSSSPARVSKPKYGASARVQRGETLYSIASRNSIVAADLAAWNGISAPYTIYPGQSLRLYPPGARPSSSHTAGAATSPRTPAGTPPAPRPGSATAPVTPPGSVSSAAATAPANSGIGWRWPADGQVVGRYAAGDATRQGVDIGGSAGQAVRAAADGVVVYSGAGLVGYGELVIIKHSETWLSAYGHNRKRLVNEGQNVKAGQQIAEMGRSGATRDMLHFEIRYNGKPVDPLAYLPAR